MKRSHLWNWNWKHWYFKTKQKNCFHMYSYLFVFYFYFINILPFSKLQLKINWGGGGHRTFSSFFFFFFSVSSIVCKVPWLAFELFERPPVISLWHCDVTRLSYLHPFFPHFPHFPQLWLSLVPFLKWRFIFFRIFKFCANFQTGKRYILWRSKSIS